jgi:hypothetical protein
VTGSKAPWMNHRNVRPGRGDFRCKARNGGAEWSGPPGGQKPGRPKSARPPPYAKRVKTGICDLSSSKTPNPFCMNREF